MWIQSDRDGSAQKISGHKKKINIVPAVRVNSILLFQMTQFCHLSLYLERVSMTSYCQALKSGQIWNSFS